MNLTRLLVKSNDQFSSTSSLAVCPVDCRRRALTFSRRCCSRNCMPVSSVEELGVCMIRGQQVSECAYLGLNQ